MGSRKPNVVFFFMSLGLAGILLSCDAKGGKVGNMENVFDEKFQQAMTEVRKLKDVSLVPCLPIGGERDYRYSYCFAERTGSAAPTMKKLHAILSAAGFKNTSQGSMDSELDATFVLAGTPYRIESNFGSMGISWVAYQEGRGYVGPRPNKGEDDAPYAILDPAQFAEMQTRQFLLNADLTKVQWKAPRLYHPCGETSATQASFCIDLDLPVAQAESAIIGGYFGGNNALFKEMDAKKSFTYAQEDLIEEMKKAGALSKNFQSSVLLKKVNEGKFEAFDTSDHPAYKLLIEIPNSQNPNAKVKITATRIPIDPKIKDEHEKLP